MPDYKEMYKIMVRAAEEAIDVLVQAQRECEELYISDEFNVPDDEDEQ